MIKVVGQTIEVDEAEIPGGGRWKAPAEDGVLLWFVAQFGRTLGRYVDGESLVWRDAGALLATVYLVCEALGLACCAIGPSGDPDMPQIVGAENELRGVGGCIVGSRQCQPTDNG